jgi:hypothetical protein
LGEEYIGGVNCRNGNLLRWGVGSPRTLGVSTWGHSGFIFRSFEISVGTTDSETVLEVCRFPIAEAILRVFKNELPITNSKLGHTLEKIVGFLSGPLAELSAGTRLIRIEGVWRSRVPKSMFVV